MSLENFTQVTTVNPRNNSADISYSTKTEKFSVSEDLYNRLNLAEKGFALYVSNSEKKIALAVVPNEDASLMRGKRGYSKGRQFTAAALVTAMGAFMPKVTEFSLEHMVSNADIDYYEMIPAQETEERSVTAQDIANDIANSAEESPDQSGESIVDSSDDEMTPQDTAEESEEGTLVAEEDNAEGEDNMPY